MSDIKACHPFSLDQNRFGGTPVCAGDDAVMILWDSLAVTQMRAHYPLPDDQN
jgi:hypothetical protein